MANVEWPRKDDRYQNGSVYEGEWEDGIDGMTKESIEYSDGRRFRRKRLKMACFMAKENLSDGRIYEGEWKEGDPWTGKAHIIQLRKTGLK